MWFSFWRSRDRFTLNELRYLVDQLQKVQIVNEVSKDFVIEALRSIAELVTYGDQHDPSFFEFFMEKKVMKEFVRILKISKTVAVFLQLLQTISIMLQNLKNEYAIYYMLSNEHVNYLITYLFDFHNEELLSYYISFLRAISGKLNKNTISLLVKTQDEEVVSFPFYVEAIRFAFHEESMVRTAVRAITLNIYHVGDDFVNKFVASAPHSDYFSNLVLFFREQCINLSKLVSECPKNPSSESVSTILASADEIEDNLYYINDVISSGIPFVGRLITDSILLLLILPLLFPALQIDADSNMKIGAVTSLYLLCSILRIVKIKDLASIIAAAFVCPLVAFVPNSEAKLNGYVSSNDIKNENEHSGIDSVYPVNGGQLSLDIPNKASFSQVHPEDIIREKNIFHSRLPLREVLLSYATDGDDALAQGSLSVLATLLQTKEMDESVLDVLGILPQCKQHKKLLLQALIGDDSGEEKLFSFESGSIRAGVSSELDKCLQNLKEQYGVSCCFSEAGMTPCIQRNQVLDALVSLLCRSNISAETLWDGGWLLRQLLPYSEAKFRIHHRKLLKDSHRNCTSLLLQETKGIWPDLLIAVLCDEWKKCKRAMEASSPWKEPKFILLPFQKLTSEDVPAESSFAAGEKLSKLVKVFVLLHQLQIFFSAGVLPEQPPIHPPIDIQEMSRARIAGLDVSGPKPETKIKLVHSLPCKIAFESPEECPFCFLAVSMGTSGWILLADQHLGDVRKAAPLAGTNPRIDEKDSRWLHLQIRPSTLPFEDPPKSGMRREIIVNRRWTLAFEDDESCKAALSMILEEINLQSNEVQRRLKPVLDLDL